MTNSKFSAAALTEISHRIWVDGADSIAAVIGAWHHHPELSNVAGRAARLRDIRVSIAAIKHVIPMLEVRTPGVAEGLLAGTDDVVTQSPGHDILAARLEALEAEGRPIEAELAAIHRDTRATLTTAEADAHQGSI